MYTQGEAAITKVTVCVCMFGNMRAAECLVSTCKNYILAFATCYWMV